MISYSLLGEWCLDAWPCWDGWDVVCGRQGWCRYDWHPTPVITLAGTDPATQAASQPDYCQPDQLLSGDTSTPTQTVSSSSFTRKPIIEWERLKSWGDGRLNIKTSLSNIASIENILHQLTKTIPFPQSSPPVVLSRPLWGKSREKQIYL